ncbi:MAG: autotransporter-associated beta strand repeat-containing protein [Kiritimatiellae bacterium]|nr:autotransporter-associated beta strand repeat-containing protein [Kiritimatiellia bacterium]
MNRIMRTVTNCLMALLSLPLLAADLEVGDGTNDNTYADSTAYAGATKIIKTGTGKTTLSFGNVTSSFAGEIEVREGTLAVDQYPGNFGSPTKITVSSGATLDLTWSGNSAGNIPKAELVIEGPGYLGHGAVCRTSGDSINGLFGTMTLTGDAVISNTVQIGFSGTQSANATVNLEGFTLSKTGSNVLYCPYTQFKKNGSTDDPGNITILQGTFFPRYNAMQGGSANNVLTLANSSGGSASVRFRELATPICWTLASTGTGDSVLGCDSVGTSQPDINNVWAGPIEPTGRLLFKPTPAKSFFTLTGNISNRQDIAITAGAKGTAKLTGTNEVNKITIRDGTLVIGGGQTDVYGPVDQTGGSLVVSNAVLRWRNAELATYPDIGDTTAYPSISVREGGVLLGEHWGSTGASSRMYIGRQTRYRGTIEIFEGAVVSNTAVNVGRAGLGAMYQTGGLVYWPMRGGDLIAETAGSYAYYGISGGSFEMDATLCSGTIWCCKKGTAVFSTRNGGRMIVDKGVNVRIASETGGNVLYDQNNHATNTFVGYFEIGNKDSRNHAATVAVSIGGENSELVATDQMRILHSNENAQITVNLYDGGTLNTSYLYRFHEETPWYVNLNGGIIKPRLAANSFASSGSTTARRPTQTTVYEKGFVIDTSDTMNSARTEYGTASIEFAFVAPGEGKRIRSITLPTGTAFSKEPIIGAPAITISGEGAGASAVAVFDNETRRLTGIVVTSPGWGYAEGTTSVTLSGGGATNTYSCAVTLEDQPTTGWNGFTKRGAQRLNMTGVNTFKGDVTVEEGILGFMHSTAAQGGMPEGAGVILKEGAMLTFLNSSTPVTVPFIRGCGTTSYGYYTVTNRIECTAEDIFAGKHLTVNQRLTLAQGATITILDPENLDNYRTAGPATVVSANGMLTCPDTISVAFAQPCATDSPQRWSVSVRGKSIVLGAKNGTVISVR